MSFKFFKVFILIGTLLFISVLFSSVKSKNIFALSSVIIENFDDNSTNDGFPIDWQELTSNWVVLNGKYRGTVSPNNDPQITLADLGNLRNYVLEVDVTGIEGVDRHILFRFSEYHVNGYSLKYREESSGVSGLIELQKHGQNVVLAVNNDFKPTTGETHKIKIVVIENNIKVYADNDVTPLIDFTDVNSPIYDGMIGFEIEPSGIGLNTITEYDNLKITPIETQAFLTVPDIKQYTLPWSEQVYDHAQNWAPKNPTISRWGCALTSGTMILQYTGYTSHTPETVNQYLQTQKGYLSNGSVLWPKISGMIKKENDSQKPKLEFRYRGNATPIIDDELELDHPVILKLGSYNTQGKLTKTHFVVAKGKEGNDYIINDPGYTNTRLSDALTYWEMELVDILSFTQSQTDVSYLVFTINDGFTINLYDSNGNIIEGDYIQEAPIVDSNDKETLSGDEKTLQSLYIPKPITGNYTLRVEGDGAYTLNTFFIDTNGDTADTTLNGFVDSVSENEKIYQVRYDKSSASISTIIEPPVIEKMTFEKLLSDLEVAYSTGHIKNKKVYTAIRSTVLLAKQYSVKGKNKLSILTLHLAKAELKAATPKYIEKITSTNLQKSIDELISQLK